MSDIISGVIGFCIGILFYVVVNNNNGSVVSMETMTKAYNACKVHGNIDSIKVGIETVAICSEGVVMLLDMGEE